MPKGKLTTREAFDELVNRRFPQLPVKDRARLKNPKFQFNNDGNISDAKMQTELERCGYVKAQEIQWVSKETES